MLWQNDSSRQVVKDSFSPKYELKITMVSKLFAHPPPFELYLKHEMSFSATVNKLEDFIDLTSDTFSIQKKKLFRFHPLADTEQRRDKKQTTSISASDKRHPIRILRARD
ncbi:hypothetical protein CEXT_778671 [Caerostris extrusa]|uniref:Uncharacterized protein n=1 Tax=Caerostris extrusa TaxID=172846 RepID=A0AAV4XNJ1_CAEEX|nr:hypothetical protein CEXT_778671 [Caerostris extrusa]